MPNYQNGKIYLLKSPNHEKVYVGSTTQTLKQRMRDHKSNYNCWKNGTIKHKTMSFDILEKGDATIELIMEYSCQTKEELLWKEREITENYDSVNKAKAVITDKERKEYQKEVRHKYYQKKYDYHKERMKNDEEYRNHDKEIKKKSKDKLKDTPITCLTCRIEYKNIFSFKEHYRRKHHTI